MKTQNPWDEKFGLSFTDLYQVLSNAVDLFGEGRKRPKWMNKDATINALALKKFLKGRFAKKAALRLPYRYQNAYVKPLLDHADLLVEQLSIANDEERTLEGLVGAIFDFAGGIDDRFSDSYHEDLSSQTQQFLAVISGLYRAFLRSPAISGSGHVRSWLPPLASFKYKAEFSRPPYVPFVIPADETGELFGGSVGVVVLPSTYRIHPILWAALAHETGGHDILWAVRGLRQELQDGVFSLFESGTWEPGVKATMRFRKSLINIDKRKFGDSEVLGHIWRYWIGEAAADIFGILNMGPAFALNAALYSSILSKQIIRELRKDTDNERLRNMAEEMTSSPRLRISPPPPIDPDNPDAGLIDPHPPDILRLATMQGAIERLEELDKEIRRVYLRKTSAVMTVSLSSQARREKICINGYLQTGVDSWESIDVKIPPADMIECAREVGRYIVTKKLKSVDNVRVQELVTWKDLKEEHALEVKKVLLEKDIEKNTEVLNNLADDAELLAGCTLALFEYPSKLESQESDDAMKHKFYVDVSVCLSKALHQSFFLDEVWGDTVLEKAWAPREAN